MIFEPGDKAFMVANHLRVREVTVVRQEGDMYLVKLGGSGAIMIRHTRLYATEAEAKKDVIALAPSAAAVGYRSPYDF